MAALRADPLEATLTCLARWRSPKPWLAYAVAVLVAVLAVAVRWWLGVLLGPTFPPYMTFYPAVMVAALFGGTGPGLVASVLVALEVDYFFLPPLGSLALSKPSDVIPLAVFFGVNVVISAICGALRAARQRTFAEARRAEASEERFQLFMDHAPTLVWIKDDQGRYTYINKAYEQRFGLALAACLGKTDADLWPPDVAARLQAADQAALAAGHSIEVTEETTEPNGALSFWLNTKFPVRDPGGRCFIASIGLDITPHKQAEDALRESEARHRLAVATAELGTYERDLITNKVTMNDTCQAILGVSEPFSPDVAPRSLHPADRARVLAEAARAFDPARRAICSAEFRILRPDGTIRWVSGRGRVLFDDRVVPARPLKFLGVLNDITEPRNSQEALRRSEARLSQAIRVARLGTFEHDHLSDTIEVSPELRQMYGFAEQEPVSLAAILERVPPEKREEIGAAVHHAHDPRGNGLFEAEYRMPVPGGVPRWVSVRSQTFFAGAGPQRHPVRTIGAVLDITVQKDHAAALTRLVQERTAKLNETVNELEHFSYTITHDMRAPLRALSGYADILRETYAPALPEPGRDLLRRISESALRMDQLITDALQYSRIVRHEQPLEPLDPAAALRGLVESYPQFALPHARVTIQPEMPRVLANKAALTQTFSNLLGNAVKFVPPGRVPEVTVSAEPRGDFIRISFVDNGIGIHPDYHQKVWQMFQRLSKNYEGTGIGLALVQKVVQRMGGRVGLESAPGQGSRFWVELRPAPL